MDMIFLILILAVSVEGLVEYGKSIQKLASGQDKKPLILQLGALVIAVSLAILASADLYTYLGVTFGGVPGVGCVLTGMFLSRGSNYISDFINRLRSGGGYITIEDVPDTTITIE